MRSNFSRLVLTCMSMGLALLVLTSCGGDSGDATRAAKHATPSSRTAPVPQSGRTPAPVVATLNSEPSLKNPVVEIADLVDNRQTELIVAGTVSSVAYRPAPDIPKTRFVVSVSQTYKGSSPQTVTVLEDGGYTKVADLYVPGKTGTQFGDDANLPKDGWVDSRFASATHPDVGDKVVLFLYKATAGTEYWEVSSVFGRLTLDDTGMNYVRPTDGGGAFERSMPRSQLLTVLTSGA